MIGIRGSRAIVFGQTGNAKAFLFRSTDYFVIGQGSLNIQKKMQPGIFFFNGNIGGERAVFYAL